jgi:hypothetical protein
MNVQEPPMDQRVFGPYYSTPPENRDQPTHTDQTLTPDQLARATRTARRYRLLTGRLRKPPTTRP